MNSGSEMPRLPIHVNTPRNGYVLGVFFIWLRGHAISVIYTWIMLAFGVPVRITMNSSYAHLRGKHRAEPVPPETHRLIADVDPPLEQGVLDLAQ
jgi:hypothetical protein